MDRIVRPMRGMERTYKNAIEILNNRRRLKRPTKDAFVGANGILQNMPKEPGFKGSPSILGMKQWLTELGYTPADINRLNIIHVAGTKGKGSTCAFIESFLRAHGARTGFPRRTGLYTSPHLIYPEERIRINFNPLSRDLFTRYFFEVLEKLSRSTHQPRYLQLFALVAIHAFIREGIDVAIFETHHGGEYDATNVDENPLVTVITPLGMDHVKQLGPTLENIAWHKAGIFKKGASAVSAHQEPLAAKVLRKRSDKKNVSLHFHHVDESAPGILDLKPDAQQQNCSVALAATRAFLNRAKTKGGSTLDKLDIELGIAQFLWPGRFQTIKEENFKWYLDAAHNEMSVSMAASWYMQSLEGEGPSGAVPRILIFSQISDERDPVQVFTELANALKGSRIEYVIFTTYKTDDGSDLLMDQKPGIASMPTVGVCTDVWKTKYPESSTVFLPTIKQALQRAKEIGEEHGGMQTLITGSQHLVGGALYIMDQPKLRPTS